MENVNILIVEDDEINMEMLKDMVESLRYTPISAMNGKEGLEKLRKGENIRAILLDWIMPEMDGMQMLRVVKEEKILRDIPVIMQTTRNDKENILEGIANGVYYYLTKPYEREVLLAILRSAVEEYDRMLALRREIAVYKTNIDDFIFQGMIRFRTIEEGHRIARWFGRFSESEYTPAGLEELFINAVEHGNLGISYDEKTELILEDGLFDDIERRLSLSQHADMFVETRFTRDVERMEVHIVDQGEGFDYEKYLDFDPERVFDPHGRGIALANHQFFDGVAYHGKGNEVSVHFSLREFPEQ